MSPEPGVIRPGRLRFLVPSVCDLVFVLLLGALTFGPLAKALLGDAGIGWHIRTGELILKPHSVPRVDPFSSTMFGKAWFAWEWLYDAAVAAVHHAAGLNGVDFFSAVVIALTFTLVLRRMLANRVNLPIAVVVLLLAMTASTIHFLARPHVLSWLFTVIWFGMLETVEADGKRRLLWLPLLTLLWVNLHGGFLVGFVLLGIYLASGLVAAWVSARVVERRAALDQTRVLAITGIAAAFVTLANPYGYKLHVHIYRYLSDRFLMDHIDEFLSPNFHGLAQKSFAVMVLLAVIAAGTRKNVRMSHLLVILFAIYTGLYAARNIPVSSILLALIMAPQLSVLVEEMAGNRQNSDGLRSAMARLDRFGGRMLGLDRSLRGHVWPILAVVFGVWICLHHGGLGSAQVMDVRFNDKSFPVQATDFLERTGSREPVFCPDRWGGYLIYRLFPRQQVVLDDRHDLYGAEFLKRYLKVVHGEPGWKKDLAEMHPGWVLVPRDSVLAGLLTEAAGWSSVYRDDTAVLFRRHEAEGTATPR